MRISTYVLNMAIYFIQSENRVKIGFGKNWSNRINQIQTSSPGQLKILLVIEGTQKQERELHKRFHHIRTRDSGEWFNLVPELWDYIKELAITSECIIVAPTIIGHAKIKEMIDAPAIEPQKKIEQVIEQNENKMVYKITPTRLNALSPAAKANAEDAIRYGLWQLVPDNTDTILNNELYNKSKSSNSDIIFPYRITTSRLAALDEARQKIMRIGQAQGLVIIEDEKSEAGQNLLKCIDKIKPSRNIELTVKRSTLEHLDDPIAKMVIEMRATKGYVDIIEDGGK